MPNQWSLVGELINLYYDDLYIRYFGIEKTIKLFKYKFYWFNINTNV